MASRLFKMMLAAEATEDEIATLYAELQYIFESPFDKAIEEAITQRGCAYYDPLQELEM